MHVNTRVKSEVDKVQNAELQCVTCETWKPSAEYKISSYSGEAERYQSWCNSCKRLDDSMRKGNKGRHPTKQQVREALSSGGFSLLASPALKQAKHKQRDTQPLSDVELALLRERRAIREKESAKPDLCYLVGVKGENKFVKIGHSHDPAARLADYQSGNPRELVLLATLPGGEGTERELHRKFMVYHTDECIGEWFRKSPEIMNHFAKGKI